MMKTRLIFVTLLCTLGGCALLSSGEGSSGPHTYGASAKDNYALGMKQLADKNFLEAERYLAFVSAKFPYSSYSALADLALADCDFQQEKFVEAIDKYRSFIKLHPTHPKDGYAAFQVGMSYDAQLPSGFFLLPSPAEKDQTDEKSALEAFNSFLIQYPSSELRAQAIAKVADLRHRLADHEMRIAAFYLEHDRPIAAAGRYQGVLTTYPGAGFDGTAALKLYQTLDELKEPDKAKAVLQQFVKDHPDDPDAAKAKKLLARG